VALMVVASAACTDSSSADSAAGRFAATVLIDPTGSIGGIVPGETRAQVETQLGEGSVMSHAMRSSSGRPFLLERIRYIRSALSILYVRPEGKPEVVFGVFTTSPRYHTKDGLHVGSSLDDARQTDGIHCSAQIGSRFSCDGGLGFEKPVTAFDVSDGRVVRVMLAAVAD
jgi:hypothetical protein